MNQINEWTVLRLKGQYGNHGWEVLGLSGNEGIIKLNDGCDDNDVVEALVDNMSLPHNTVAGDDIVVENNGKVICVDDARSGKPLLELIKR